VRLPIPRKGITATGDMEIEATPSGCDRRGCPLLRRSASLHRRPDSRWFELSRVLLLAAGRVLRWTRGPHHLAPESSLCRSPGPMFVPMPCRGLGSAARRAGGRQCRGQGHVVAAVAPRPTGGLLPRVARPCRARSCSPRNQNRHRGLPRAGR
jgi:hypothetical protein